MSAYMLVEIAVKDEPLYARYVELVTRVVEKYQGRYVVRSSKVSPNSGGWTPDRIILIRFDTLVDLRKCFASREYSELSPLRERSTVTRSVIVEE